MEEQREQAHHHHHHPPDLESCLSLGPNEELDVVRSEEPWGSNNEGLLLLWMKEWLTAKDLHQQRAKRLRTLSTMVSLPAVLVPVLMAPLAGRGPEDGVPSELSTGAFLVSAVLSGTMAFFEFRSKANEHDAHSHKYADLGTDVQLELSKLRRFRRQADVFLTEVKMRHDQLERSGPPL